MPKHKRLILPSIALNSAGAKGVAIGRTEEGKAVMVKGAVPGDLADVRVVKKKKSHLMGEVHRLIEPSPSRTDPACAHFELCGGCVWQNMVYEDQLRWKDDEVVQNLRRIGGVEPLERSGILPAPMPFGYRNKMEFSFTSERWLSAEEIDSGRDIADRRALGFHIPGRWDRIFEVENCLLQPDPSNAIRNQVGKWAREHDWSFYHPRERTGWLRNLMIRNNREGDFMVMVQTGYREEAARKILAEKLLESFPQISSLWFAVNEKTNDAWYDLDMELVSGQEAIIEKMKGWNGGPEMQFRIGPKSFYQTNPEQASELYRIALDMSGIEEGSIVYDLYSGTGTIALYMAQRAAKVIGVEGVEEAVQDAQKNAALNGIENAHFFAGDMRKVLNEDFFAREGVPDVVMTDPPREGMHPDVVAQLLSAAPKRIVYISCNSATQARDVALLKEAYQVSKSRAVDMFPQTAHVENVLCLDRLDGSKP